MKEMFLVCWRQYCRNIAVSTGDKSTDRLEWCE